MTGSKKPSELLRELNELDEGQRIEAKRASQVGKSVMETVSAFSNTVGMDGGYLLLGVSPDQGDLFGSTYTPEGIADPDKVSADLASQCAAMLNEPVRPVIEREEVDGKVLLSAYIPEASPDRKPVYIQSRGLPKGACIRVGTTDQRCTDGDLERFYKARSLRKFDGRLLEDTSLADASPTALENYRRARRERDAEAPELRYDDAALLRALRVVRPDDAGVDRFTVAGLLLFGTKAALADYFPAVRVDYTRVQGRSWGSNGADRYTSLDLYGSIFEVVYRLEAAIMDDLPSRFSLPEGSLHRVDLPLLPRKVVREALVNALMHRDYETNSPTQIVRYSNRIEFHNAGYSLKPEAELGTVGSKQRNPSISRILHETRLAEGKGSGIKAMRDKMQQQDLTPPTFASSREHNRFVATLLMLHILEPETLQWLSHFESLGLSREERQALVYARETGRIDNEACRNLNNVETANASRSLVRLRDFGLLSREGSGSATYYLPTKHLLNPEIETAPPPPPFKGSLDLDAAANSPTTQDAPPITYADDAITQALAPITHELSLRRHLSDDLKDRLISMSPRTNTEDMRAILLDLTRVRAWSAEDLATLVGRTRNYLMRNHLKHLIEAGQIVRLESSARSPHQAYRAADAPDDE